MLGLLPLVVGCGPRATPAGANLEAPDPAERIWAIKTAVEAGGSRAGPTLVVALVDRLDDEDDRVRFFAIAELARLTGRRLGYRAHDPARVRRVAIDRWRRYLEIGTPDIPADGPSVSE